VGAVTLTVTITTTSKVLEELGASIKVRMLNVDTGVNDVRASTLASALVVGVSLAARSGAGNAGDTPRSIVLVDGSLDGDDSILLNVLDLRFVSITLTDWLGCIGLTLGSCLSFSISSSLRLAAKPLKLLV
jgi:hypothetical protein